MASDWKHQLANLADCGVGRGRAVGEDNVVLLPHAWVLAARVDKLSVVRAVLLSRSTVATLLDTSKSSAIILE